MNAEAEYFPSLMITDRLTHVSPLSITRLWDGSKARLDLKELSVSTANEMICYFP